MVTSHYSETRNGRNPIRPHIRSKIYDPIESRIPGVRRRLLPEREDSNNLMLLDELDLINERRNHALIRIENYQQAAAKYYNTNVRSRVFKEGDLVLRIFSRTPPSGTQENSGQTEKDLTKSLKKFDQVHTKSQTCRTSKFRELGTRCTSRNTTTKQRFTRDKGT